MSKDSGKPFTTPYQDRKVNSLSDNETPQSSPKTSPKIVRRKRKKVKGTIFVSPDYPAITLSDTEQLEDGGMEC